MPKERRSTYQERWKASYQEHVRTLLGDPAHQMDWHTAQFLFNTGHRPDDAAKRYVDKVHNV
jgi:hypothetical protein